MLTLNSDELHLWFAFSDEIQNTELTKAYQNLMTPEEKVQQQRFRFAKHQHQYLVTRALVRTTLSRYCSNVKPGEWRFVKNDYGKPEIIASEGMPPLRFNLSHTENLIICGVVLEQEIGVDVEYMERKGTSVDIADRFFSQQEVDDLYTLVETQRLSRFFDYWTLKESYIKARGMGLSLPLEQFTFHLLEHEPLHISFDSKLRDDPNRWQFWLLQPTAHHKAAISVSRGENRRYQLTLKKVVPLMEDMPFSCSVLRQS